MTVEVGGKTVVLRPGSMGHIPRNAVHSFKVTSEEVCQVLSDSNPPGGERPGLRQAGGAAARRDGQAGLVAGIAVLRTLLGRTDGYALGDSEVWSLAVFKTGNV